MRYQGEDAQSLNSVEFWVSIATVFLLCAIAFKFIFMKAGLIAASNPLSLAAAGILSAVMAWVLRKSDGSALRLARSAFDVKLMLLLGLVFAYVAIVHLPGVVLPVHDPVLNTTFAAIISRGINLYDFYPLGESSHAYPPGFPLLLSYGFMLTDKIGVLLLFKWGCLLIVALIPLAWAWMTKRCFSIAAPMWIVALGFYLSFFTIERSLNFVLPFAGKNSTLLALLLFPIFVVFLVTSARVNLIALAVAGFCLFGLALIHYSVFHLAVAVLLPLFGFYVFQRKDGLRLAVLTGLAGIGGVGLFFALWRESLSDPRPLFGAVNGLIPSLELFLQTFYSLNESYLTIFSPFQSVGSPMRGYLLAACCLFSFWVSHALQTGPQRDNAKKLAIAGTSYLIATVIAFIFGSRLIPAGINIDYARWFIFPAQAATIGCAVLSAALFVWQRKSVMSITLGSAVVVVSAIIFLTDSSIIARKARQDALSKQQLLALRDAFQPGEKGCLIVAPTTDPYARMVKNFVYMQAYRPLEYAEFMTPCTIASGAFVHGAARGWSTAAGTPEPDAYGKVADDMAVYFVGNDNDLPRFGISAKQQMGGSLLWTKTDHLRGEPVSVWKIGRYPMGRSVETGYTAALPAQVNGHIDTVTIEKDKVSISGWAPWRSATSSQTLHVLSNQSVKDPQLSTNMRPDVARYLNSSEFIASGFSLGFALDSPAAGEKELLICIVVVDSTGQRSILNNPQRPDACAILANQ